jgi:hypothetical protein
VYQVEKPKERSDSDKDRSSQARSIPCLGVEKVQAVRRITINPLGKSHTIHNFTPIVFELEDQSSDHLRSHVSSVEAAD